MQEMNALGRLSDTDPVAGQDAVDLGFAQGRDVRGVGVALSGSFL